MIEQMKRIVLFLATNLAIMIALSIVFHVACALLGVDPAAVFAQNGLDYFALALFALVYGMFGSIVSLLLSKPVAKWSTKAKTITGEEGEAERWLVDTVAELAEKAGVRTPEVAIYPGEPNAFATGAFKNSALVAVSTGIMPAMTRDELRAVLGHEMSHVANGDMVTMTLLQGVLNAFVIFLSRVVAFVAANAAKGGRKGGAGTVIYHVVHYAMQILLGVLASIVAMWFSRKREYAADAGSARLLGSAAPMIAALKRLENVQPGVLPDSIKAFGIAGGIGSLFASHPSIDQRVAALEGLRTEA